MSQDSARHNLLVCGAVHGLATWYDLLERNGRFLEQVAAEQIYQQGMMSLQCFGALSVEAHAVCLTSNSDVATEAVVLSTLNIDPLPQALAEAKTRWFPRPKCHRFHHLCKDTVLQGP